MDNPLSAVDYSLLLLYLAGLFILGFMRSRRGGSSVEEYIVAGRRLSLPAFVATLVSTWYGGILGVGEYSYQYGLSNWLVFGVPYYLYAIIFALFIAGRAWHTKRLTIPDQLEQSYGRKAGLAGALFVFVLSTPAPYVLMLGVLCRMLLGWPLWLGASAGALFSMIYAFRGGLSAIVRTEILQFVLMFAGFALILFFAGQRFGGFGFLSANLPPTHLTWHGGNSPLFILAWYCIAMSTLVDPGFYQRCYAAQSARTARRGILISVGCWFLFDFMTTTTGLYARAALAGLENAAESYPRLAVTVLPHFARGLFFVALLATIMSTIDGYAFVSAITLGRDLLWKWRGSAIVQPGAEPVRWIRLSLICTFALAVGLAVWSQSVVSLWYQVGTLATPALLIPLASSFLSRWKMSSSGALVAMLGSAAVTGVAMLAQSKGLLLWELDPIYWGLMSSASIFVVDHLLMSRHRLRSGNRDAGNSLDRLC
jgi:SSS family solute:Na+ symporter